MTPAMPMSPTEAPRRPGVLSDLTTLAKPRITVMATGATVIGYLLGWVGVWDPVHLAGVVVFTLFLGGGASALNQYVERDSDRLMQRTRERPLPTRRFRPGWVLVGGTGAALVGVAGLAVWANALAGVVAATVAGTYVLAYTPLKRITGLNTIVGAVPGALPPVLGWAAARGSLGPEALALFLILFVWQHPHFLSIAWLYREDYAAAGMPMLTTADPDSRIARRQMFVYGVTLIPVSLYPTIIGMAGEAYFFTSLALGLVFLATVVAMILRPTRVTALLVLKVSIVDLPAVLGVLLYDATL